MKKGNLSRVLIAAVAAALVFTASADAAPPTGTTTSHDQTVLQALADQGARISRDPHSGRVSFIGTNPGRALAVAGMAAGQAPADNARAALNRYAGLFGITDPGTELRSMRQVDIPDGRSMVRYQQLYQGLPVIGGEIIVNMDSAGRMSSMNGEAMPGLALGSTPTIGATQAQQRAVDSVAAFYNIDASLLAATTPTLSVYAPSLIGPQDLGATLVWQLEVESGPANGIDEYVLVDAKAGHIALHFSRVDYAKNRKTYDGSSVNIGLTNLPGTLLCNESAGDNCTGGADTDADDAQAYAGDTYDFYKNNFGRDSIDGNGMAIVSSVHFAYGCPNAFWWPPTQQMVYCDGMPEGDDVVGHELTHGVTDHTSDLFYYYQSGAINESMSDVFGEFIDLTNSRGVGDDPSLLWPSGTRWALGEGSSIGVLRFMWDPTQFSQPDKMSSTYYATGSSDNGGVHTNSGINNHAAALMVDGGLFNGVTISGIGIPKAAQIYYEVETHLLTSGADYYDLYNDLYQGCLNLVGTHGITNSDCTEVRNATLAVEMNGQPTGATNPDADLCPLPTGGVPSNLFFDDFEGGNLNNWTLGGSNSSSVWSIDATWTGPYAAGSLHSLYADDVVLSNDSYTTMKNGVAIPAGGMYLHFDHAFGFDAGGDGGARLLYSTDGNTFIDASGLFDSGGINPGQTYNGTATAGAFSGKSAFVNDSHGYVGSRYYIPATTGNKIWFRWELATGAAWNQGWWIDNVRLYTCVANSAPSAPQLISPASGSVNVASSSVTFSWKPSTDADGDTINYQLAVCTDAAFTSCVVSITKSAATRPFTAAAMGGGAGLFLLSLLMAGRRRRVGAILGILALVGLLVSCGGSSSSSTTVSYTAALSPATKYYWHVTANDGNGGTAVSSDWNFTTAP